MCIAVATTYERQEGCPVAEELVFHRIIEFLNFDYESKRIRGDLDFFVENCTEENKVILFVHRAAVNMQAETDKWEKHRTSEDPLCKRVLAFHENWQLTETLTLKVPRRGATCNYGLSSAIPKLVVGERDDSWRPYSLFSLGPFAPGREICRVSFTVTGASYEYLLGSRSRFMVEGGEIMMRKIMLEDIPNTGDDPIYETFLKKYIQFHRLWKEATRPRQYEVVLWADDPELLPRLPTKPCEMTELNSEDSALNKRTLWLVTPEVDKFQVEGTVAAGNFILCTR